MWKRITVIVALAAFLGLSWAVQRNPVHLLAAIADFPSVERLRLFAAALDIAPAASAPVTLIKVDDETYKAWNYPLPMSRKHLSEAIGKAAEAGPLAIIVDYDLSAKAADDPELLPLLKTWPTGGPLLLLSKQIVYDEKNSTVAAAATPFDGLVKQQPRIAWFNPLFESGEDSKITYWNLWDVDCATGEIYWAPQVYTALANMADAAAVKAMNVKAGKEPCRSYISASSLSVPGHMKALPRQMSLDYMFGWNNRPVSALPPITLASGASVNPLFQWSALQLTRGGLDPSMLKDRVVIIGSSVTHSEDRHDTPVGEMEGMRIIANAVATAPRILNSRTASDTAVTLAAVILASAFAWLQGKLREVPFVAIATLGTIFAYAVSARIFNGAAAIDLIARMLTYVLLIISIRSLYKFGRDILSGRAEGSMWRRAILKPAAKRGGDE